MFKKILIVALVLAFIPILAFGEPPHANSEFRGRGNPFEQKGSDSDKLDLDDSNQDSFKDKDDKPGKNPSDEQKERKIINFSHRPTSSQMKQLRGEGVSARNYSIVNAAVANIPQAAMDKVQGKPFVNSIEEDYQVELVLDDSLQQIEADKVHEEGYFGDGTSVAVLDTGIDDHEDLQINTQKDFTGEGLGDRNGHGTHVAGIIGSSHTDYQGVSEGVELYDLKVLNENGTGYASDILNALEWAVKEDVEVINMSFGAPVENCDGEDVLSEAINNAYQEGTLSVVAAGNRGPEEETITLPGCAEEAITVGAVDSESSISSFSSRGPTADGRVKPDLVAPGRGITSSWLDNQFTSLSGTSMAAPHVTGSVSLLSEAGVLPVEAGNLLETAAEDLGRQENTQGEGELNVYQAFNSLEDGEDDSSEEEEKDEDDTDGEEKDEEDDTDEEEDEKDGTDEDEEEDEDKDDSPGRGRDKGKRGPPEKRGTELAQERRDQTKRNREEVAKHVEEKREDLGKIMEDSSEKTRVMNLADTLERMNQRLTDRYINRLEALDTLLGNFEQIVTRREEKHGVELESARERLERLEETIDEAWSLAEKQTEKDYYIDVDSSEEVEEAFDNMKHNLQEDHQRLQEKIMVRPTQNLGEVFQDLR